MGFKMIYWTPISGSYFLKGCILEKCGNLWKNGRFSRPIWPDWENTARADMAGLGSIGIIFKNRQCIYCRNRTTCIMNKKRFPYIKHYCVNSEYNNGLIQKVQIIFKKHMF